MTTNTPLQNQAHTQAPAAPVRPPTVQSLPAPTPPPQAFMPVQGHVYYPQPGQEVRSGKVVGSYVMAAISTLFIPIIFGPIAIWLAHTAGKEGDPRAATAKTVAICCMIGGMVLGAALAVGSI